MAKAAYNRDRWYIETSEIRTADGMRFRASLNEHDGRTWQRVWTEPGFLSRSDARKEAIAKISELEAA